MAAESDKIREQGEGKGASIWTMANIVTIIRITFVPLWLALAQLAPQSSGEAVSWLGIGVFVFYVLLSLTDSLDGYLARSRGEVSDFGKFLDPIADKLVVIVALAFLLECGYVSSWVILIIVGREFLVSGLRMIVASKGPVIAASMLGKFKTAFTMIAIGLLLLHRYVPAGSFAQAILMLGNVLMVAALALTIWSGVDYFVKSWKYIA